MVVVSPGLTCVESDVVHEAHTGGQDLVTVGTLELLTRGLVAHRPALRHHHLCGPCAGLTLDPGVKMQKSSFKTNFFCHIIATI